MTDDPRIQQLLDELLDSHSTPEEVCGSCPDLLPAVRDRWRQMCRVRAELDALFPPPTEPGTRPPALPPEGTALPRTPGYEVEAVLGRGGMGVVFRARHLALNRRVALKMALDDAHAGPHERGRFQREAEAVAGLQHPNVVQIHDVADSAGRPYFTMELVEGGSLAQKLAGTPQPARQATGAPRRLQGRGTTPRTLLLACGGNREDTRVADFQSLSLEELEALCDKRLLELFRSFHRDNPQEYRNKIIKHLKRYNLPIRQLLDAIHTHPAPEQAWRDILSVCRHAVPAAPWDDLASPEIQSDIANSRDWLATQLRRMPEATGIYLGLDTLNMRQGLGHNVEIGGTSECDSLYDSQDWLNSVVTCGKRHLIRGLYEMHAAYTQGSWRVVDEEAPLGGYAGFAGYAVWLTYSGLVLGHALSRVRERQPVLAVWGFHDGDMFLLGRMISDGFTFLCR